jgi:GNAT superfamily N-acetyltransferase
MPPRRPWAYERGTLWAMDLDGQALHVPAPQAAATCGEVPRETAAPLAAAMGLADAREVRRRFTAGSRCFAARVDGAIAAYGWVSQGVERIGELERSLRMRSDEAYIWDCATLPPYRRCGLYTALLGHIAASLRGEGIHRLWIGASLQNRPSIRGFAAAGFRPVIRLTYARLLSLSRVWVADDPTTPPELVADARRALVDPREQLDVGAAVGDTASARSDVCAEEKCL